MAPATLWAEVPPLLKGPGEYDVRFQFLDGDVGLDTHSVALLDARGGNEEKPLDEDLWNCHVDSPTWVDYCSLLLKGAEVPGNRVMRCSCGWKSLPHLL